MGVVDIRAHTPGGMDPSDNDAHQLDKKPRLEARRCEPARHDEVQHSYPIECFHARTPGCRLDVHDGYRMTSINQRGRFTQHARIRTRRAQHMHTYPHGFVPLSAKDYSVNAQCDLATARPRVLLPPETSSRHESETRMETVQLASHHHQVAQQAPISIRSPQSSR